MSNHCKYNCSPMTKYTTLEFFCLQYAQETQHEKILRGLAVGIAFTMYGRLEEADPLVTSLCADKDPILRRSGMYTLAMAYCGTGNNQAIRKLLHVAVSTSLLPSIFVQFFSVFIIPAKELQILRNQRVV